MHGHLTTPVMRSAQDIRYIYGMRWSSRTAPSSYPSIIISLSIRWRASSRSRTFASSSRRLCIERLRSLRRYTVMVQVWMFILNRSRRLDEPALFVILKYQVARATFQRTSLLSLRTRRSRRLSRMYPSTLILNNAPRMRHWHGLQSVV